MIRFILTVVSALMAALVATAPAAAADPYVHYQHSVDQFAVENGLAPASWVNVGTGEIAESACGPIPSSMALAYCDLDSLAYIGDDAGQALASHHPLAPAIAIAHEWGHSLHHKAGSLSYTQATEDGADCVAGAWLAWANHNGTIKVGAADLPGLYSLLDSVKKDESNEFDIHGTLFDRGAAMISGFTFGLDYCGFRYMAIR